MSVKTVKSFCKQFLAELKGDTNAALAEKTFRSVDSTLSAHIAIQTGKTETYIDAIEVAIENLRLARINSCEPLSFEKRDLYVQKLVDAKNNLEEAQEQLEEHLKILNFLKEEKELLNVDVPVTE